MISNLIEFGKWLNENKQDDFGKNVKENDYIFNISFNDNSNNFNFGQIVQVSNYHSNFSKKSIFSKQCYITTDQKFIQNKSNLIGLTPFFLKIDHDFRKKGDIDKEMIKKFLGKIERSKISNEKEKGFIGVIKDIYNDIDDYLNKIGVIDEERNHLISFFKDYTIENVKWLINAYYNWLWKNKDQIVGYLERFKNSDEYEKKLKGNFYLACYFNSDIDLLSDIFYYYSKFIKPRNKSYKEHKMGICAFCGLTNVVYPSTGSYSIVKPSYLFNYDKNKKTALENSRLKFCKKCATYAMLAEDKLKKILVNNIIVIPKRNKGDYSDFLMISNKEINSFVKINNFMDLNRDFNYDLVIYTIEQGDILDIKKYIENYKAYLAKFENINLFQNDRLSYLFNEYYKKGKYDKSEIENIFDFEIIFKQFFINIKDEKIYSPKFFCHFYQIYTKDLTGKTGIFYGYDSKTVSIFAKYMHNIFNLIYELNNDALNKNMLNEIVFNSLIKLQKHSKVNKKTQRGLFFYDILRRLNYYFMLKKEILGDNMLKAENVARLKELSLRYNKNSDLKKIDLKDLEDIFEMSEKDPALKYYLIGQFLGLIDNSKRRKDKKAEVFSNFVTNANRNNIRNLFVTEVLQKNNYYISKMNKKGKIIFKLFEENINSFFNELDGFSFEDYILLIFTGYYTENILSSEYGAKKEGGNNE